MADIRMIETQLMDYEWKNKTYPASLQEINDALRYEAVPLKDPTGNPYEYTKKGNDDYELCFITASGKWCATGKDPGNYIEK